MAIKTLYKLRQGTVCPKAAKQSIPYSPLLLAAELLAYALNSQYSVVLVGSVRTNVILPLVVCGRVRVQSICDTQGA